MPEQKQTEKCNQCNSELFGDFCASCGQPRKLRRIDGQYIFSEIGSVLNFDRGILFTFRELLLRPGASVQKFILEDRSRLVKPILFIIVCSLLYSIAQQVMHFEDGYVNYNFDELKNSATGAIFQWISQNYGYANILMAAFIALWIKLLFRKYDYNYYEIIILLCFVMGIAMLIFAIFGTVESLTGLPLFQFGAYIGFIYISWAIGQFFDKRKFMNYVKGLLSYLLGMIFFMVAATAIGIAIDLFMK